VKKKEKKGKRERERKYENSLSKRWGLIA